MADFRLLGEMQLHAGGVPLELGPRQQRTVLAALLVDVGRAVPLDVLVRRVWDDDPPRQARNALYVNLTRVRRLLGRAAELEPADDPVQLDRRPTGYLLTVAPDRIDLHRCRRLGDAARRERDDAARERLLRSALDEWRGTPLAGLAGSWVDQVRDASRRHHQDALVRWGETALRLGAVQAVLTELGRVAEEYPLAEPLVGLRMRALCVDGRRSEALSCFAETRQRLDEELGTGPGPDLVHLNALILRGEVDDPGAGGRGPSPAGASTTSRAASPAGPEQPTGSRLPADPPSFTGRREELAALDTLLGEADPQRTMLIVALTGPDGVGTTTLAAHWARRVADRFPDGLLFVDLQHAADREGACGRALTGALKSLGVAATDIPFDLAERSARYRTVMARRRMLVVLDGATSVGRVRPLLPGTPSCVVLVTSGNPLPGLVARDGARRIPVGPLPPADAVTFARTLVDDRAAAESRALAAAVERCARLPLAVRVASAFAVSRPESSPADLATELAAELVAPGRAEEETTVEAAALRDVLSWAHRRLPSGPARTLRLLGLLPGLPWSAELVAALTGETTEAAGESLDLLVRSRLVEDVAPSRFRVPHAVLADARSRALAVDPPSARHDAVDRVLDHRLAVLARDGPAGDDRVDDGWDALVTLVEHVAADGRPGPVLRLAERLRPLLLAAGRRTDALAVAEAALRAARDPAHPVAGPTADPVAGPTADPVAGPTADPVAGPTADPSVERLALLGLAEVLWAWGRSAQARDHLIEALAPDGTGGGDHPSDGEPAPVSEGPDAALLHHQDAFDRATRSGDAIGRAVAAAELAHVHLACGRSGEAHRLWRSALDLATGSCPVPSPPARGGGMTRS
ncbi:MAG: hypothetical protein GXX79_18235 [Actinomycetales bacterium]|nr:hypothetical protein [Actinomycetales bacterium]